MAAAPPTTAAAVAAAATASESTPSVIATVPPDPDVSSAPPTVPSSASAKSSTTTTTTADDASSSPPAAVDADVGKDELITVGQAQQDMKSLRETIGDLESALPDLVLSAHPRFRLLERTVDHVRAILCSMTDFITVMPTDLVAASTVGMIAHGFACMAQEGRLPGTPVGWRPPSSLDTGSGSRMSDDQYQMILDERLRRLSRAGQVAHDVFQRAHRIAAAWKGLAFKTNDMIVRSKSISTDTGMKALLKAMNELVSTDGRIKNIPATAVDDDDDDDDDSAVGTSDSSASSSSSSSSSSSAAPRTQTTVQGSLGQSRTFYQLAKRMLNQFASRPEIDDEPDGETDSSTPAAQATVAPEILQMLRRVEKGQEGFSDDDVRRLMSFNPRILRQYMSIMREAARLVDEWYYMADIVHGAMSPHDSDYTLLADGTYQMIYRLRAYNRVDLTLVSRFKGLSVEKLDELLQKKIAMLRTKEAYDLEMKRIAEQVGGVGHELTTIDDTGGQLMGLEVGAYDTLVDDEPGAGAADDDASMEPYLQARHYSIPRYSQVDAGDGRVGGYCPPRGQWFLRPSIDDRILVFRNRLDPSVDGYMCADDVSDPSIRLVNIVRVFSCLFPLFSSIPRRRSWIRWRVPRCAGSVVAYDLKMSYLDLVRESPYRTSAQKEAEDRVQQRLDPQTVVLDVFSATVMGGGPRHVSSRSLVTLGAQNTGHIVALLVRFTAKGWARLPDLYRQTVVRARREFDACEKMRHDYLKEHDENTEALAQAARKALQTTAQESSEKINRAQVIDLHPDGRVQIDGVDTSSSSSQSPSASVRPRLAPKTIRDPAVERDYGSGTDDDDDDSDSEEEEEEDLSDLDGQGYIDEVMASAIMACPGSDDDD